MVHGSDDQFNGYGSNVIIITLNREGPPWCVCSKYTEPMSGTVWRTNRVFMWLCLSSIAAGLSCEDILGRSGSTGIFTQFRSFKIKPKQEENLTIIWRILVFRFSVYWNLFSSDQLISLVWTLWSDRTRYVKNILWTNQNINNHFFDLRGFLNLFLFYF